MNISFRKFIIYILFTVVLVSSCNYVKNVKLLTSGSLESRDFVQTIPFEYKKDLIVISAFINGRAEPNRFILDTGAFESKIELGLAEELNLPTKAERTNSTAQGISQTIEITQLETVLLGETNFSKISAGKLSYNEVSASQCIAPDGIIGANLMKLAHWRIDYQNQKIQFSDTPFKAPESNGYHLDFKKSFLSGTPEVDIVVAGKTVSGVIFDVGFNGGLILPASLSHSFPSENERLYLDQSTSGIFGSDTDTLTSKKLDVSIGGYGMNIPVEFSSIGKALLGNDILEHFDVTINYKKKRIELHPQTQIHVAPAYSFIPGILNDSLWVVNRATPELPFSLGDTLRTVNENKPADLYDSFCEYFFSVSELLKQDSISVSRMDGASFIITSNP